MSGGEAVEEIGFIAKLSPSTSTGKRSCRVVASWSYVQLTC
jgi:hypothetical protein